MITSDLLRFDYAIAVDIRELTNIVLNEMPTPVASAYDAFLSEQQPFRKLHRLIDVYEIVLKFVGTLALQNFYTKGLPKQFPEADRTIREKLSRASSGDWVMFLRETLKCLRQHRSLLFTDALEHLSIEAAADKLNSLRNDYRGHGATLDDDRAAQQLQAHEPFLEEMLKACAFLADLRLLHVSQQHPDGSYTGRQLIGRATDNTSQEKLTLPNLPVGHVLVVDRSSGAILDLHPLIVFDHPSGLDRRILIFNSIKNKSADFLDYATGDHHYFDHPHPLPGVILQQFQRPRPAAEADWFTDFIEASTQHFVGRKQELESLSAFAAGGTKRALVVVGPPGIGKTALLSQWAKHEVCARHFIREGDVATQEPTAVFENLGLQLAKMCQLEWKKPTGANVTDFRTEFEHVLREASAKAISPIILLIDGLDEAERTAKATKSAKGQKTVADWLPEPSLFPENIRWLFSVRPELLDDADFSAKFGSDKAQHLTLCRMQDYDIQALLFQVCSWHEVLGAQEAVRKILQLSEGHPLYLRMLIEDVAAGQIKLAAVDRLPSGVEGYFKRVLESIEREGRAIDMPDANLVLRSKIEILQRLRDQGLISRTQFEQFCKQEKAALEGKAGCRSLDLLGLFAAAKEPLLLMDAASAMRTSFEETDRAFRVIRTILEERREDQFAIFHSAFSTYFIRERADVVMQARQRIAVWCSEFSSHKRPYALRHYVSHLCDAVRDPNLPPGREESLRRLEACLTDLSDGGFIELKAKADMVADLLKDYETVLAEWPGHVRDNPLNVPSVSLPEAWARECVIAVLGGHPDPHPDCGAGPVLHALRERIPQGFMGRLGCLLRRDDPYLPPDPTVMDEYFPPSSPTSAAIEASQPAGFGFGATTTSVAKRKPAGRIEEFYSFVLSRGHILSERPVDVGALAFNYKSTGFLAQQAEAALRQRPRLWIKRHNRPDVATGRPLFVRALAQEGEQFISSDLSRSVAAFDDRRAPDGKRVVTFRVADVRTGEVLQSASETFGVETMLCWAASPLTVSSDLKTALFLNAAWDVQTARLKTILGDEPVREFVMTPDGRLAVTASHSKELQVWDIATGENVRRLEERDREVHGLSISQDGKVLAVACHKGDMQLWDVAAAELILTFANGIHVRTVALAPDARFVTFGDTYGTVWVLDVARARVLRRFSDECDHIFAVAITPDGRILAAEDGSGFLRVWDVKSGRLLRRIPFTSRRSQLSLSANGALAVVGSQILDLRQGEPPAESLTSGKRPTSVAISTGGQKVLTGHAWGDVSLSEFGAKNPVRTFRRPPLDVSNPEGAAGAVLYSSFADRRGETAFVAYDDSSLYLADLATGVVRPINSPEFLRRLVQQELPKAQADVGKLHGEDKLPEDMRELCRRPPETHYDITEANLTPDGRFAITSRYGEAVRVWSMATGECIRALPTRSIRSFSEGEVMCLKATSDSKSVVFATADGRVHVWRFLESSESLVLPRDDAGSFSYVQVAVSADACRLVYGSSEEPLELWDIPSTRLLRRFERSKGIPRALAFTPNGDTVISAEGGNLQVNRITVWSAETGTVTATCPLPANPIALSEVTANGRFACCTANGEVHHLSLETSARTGDMRS